MKGVHALGQQLWPITEAVCLFKNIGDGPDLGRQAAAGRHHQQGHGRGDHQVCESTGMCRQRSTLALGVERTRADERLEVTGKESRSTGMLSCLSPEAVC